MQSVSEAKTAGEDNDKDKDKDEVYPLTLESLVGPLKSQLLLLCRIAKEQLSDDTLSHVTLRFPAALIRKYSSDFVILRGERIDVEGESKKVDNDDAVEGEEEEEFKWSVVSPEKEEEAEEGEGDLVMDILREEFEAACLPVLEVRLMCYIAICVISLLCTALHCTELHCTGLHLTLNLSYLTRLFTSSICLIPFANNLILFMS
jgi:hypothetical protein